MKSLNASKKYKKTKLGYIPVDWELCTLGNCIFNNGKYGANSSALKYDKTMPRYLRITDIKDNGELAQNKKASIKLAGNEKYLLENNDFVFARTGNTVGKTYLYQSKDGNLLYAGYLIKYSINHDKLLPNYLKGFTQSSRYWSWVKNTIRSGAQPNINANEYKSLIIPLPSLPEQKKIAEILSCWDDCIGKLENVIKLKEKRKKGLMQKLLTGKVRLPEFNHGTLGKHGIKNDELPVGWEKAKLNDVFERVTRKNTINSSNVLTISAQHGLISQKDYFNKSVAGKNLSNYMLLQNGEFAYNKSYSNGYPMGAIKRLDKYDTGIVSTLYICYRLKNMDSNSNYFKHYFDAGLLNEEIHGIAQEGARNHGLLNISVPDFFNMKIIISNTLEQKAIADILDCADMETEKLRKKLEAVKNQKKGLMQKLLTGEIRHPEFATTSRCPAGLCLGTAEHTENTEE